MNLEKQDFVEKIKSFEAKIQTLNSEIMKRDTWIAELQGDIILIKEDMLGHDEMIDTLNKTIL